MVCSVTAYPNSPLIDQWKKKNIRYLLTEAIANFKKCGDFAAEASRWEGITSNAHVPTNLRKHSRLQSWEPRYRFASSSFCILPLQPVAQGISVLPNATPDSSYRTSTDPLLVRADISVYDGRNAWVLQCDATPVSNTSLEPLSPPNLRQHRSGPLLDVGNRT